MDYQRSSVSIHAPWEGCDADYPIGIVVVYTFQFTHPGKGATNTSLQGGILEKSFNSRTLGRVRPDYPIGIVVVYTFQFTHPGKGATGIKIK